MYMRKTIFRNQSVKVFDSSITRDGRADSGNMVVPDKLTSRDEEPLNKKHEEQNNEKEKETDPNGDLEKKTFFQKLCHLRSNITVEPIMAGLVIPSMLSRLAIQNLNLEKTCRIKLGIGLDICSSLVNKDNLTLNATEIKSYEHDIQRVISAIETWKSFIQMSIPTLLIIFMGAWSDRTGNRKVPILLPIFGELLVCISNILSTYFFDEISVEVTMLLEGLFPAITGGWVMIYLGVFSYISDITSEETRTFRVGLVNLCMTAGIPIGTALSGILLKLLGYYGIFIISGSIYVITLSYAAYYLESSTKPNNNQKEKKAIKCSDLVHLVKETGQVAFKKRDGNLRLKIILCLLVVAIIYGPNHGERIVFYLFLRNRLNWDALRYSFYSTYSIITHSIGALFSISVFSKRWGFHDSALCLISVVSKLAGSIFLVYVSNDFQMFMVPLVEILNATTFTSLRAMATKLVSSEEMGKMNSLFSLVETLAGLVFDPTYSALYYYTVKVFSGAVFVFSSLATIPPIAILVWFFTQHRKEVAQARTQELENRKDIINEPFDIVEA